jgi:DNA-binding SARP family transcriptional activator
MRPTKSPAPNHMSPSGPRAIPNGGLTPGGSASSVTCGVVRALAGAALRLGGPRQRALLAILLLHPGEVVSSERLAEGIWGERAPPSARHLVQVYVSQLRGVLDGSAAAIVTREPGYLADIDPARTDARRFERLVTAARDVEEQAPGDALRALDRALALWGGPRSRTHHSRAALRSTSHGWTRCA